MTGKETVLNQPEVERRRVIDDQFEKIRERFELMDNKMQGQVERTVVLHEQVQSLDEKVSTGLQQLAENTKVTTEVRDLLVTGKTMGKLVKWVSGIAASVIAAYAAWRGLK